MELTNQYDIRPKNKDIRFHNANKIATLVPRSARHDPQEQSSIGFNDYFRFFYLFLVLRFRTAFLGFR